MAGPEDPLRAAYAVESAAESRKGAQVACFLAIAIVPLFAVLDAVIFPDRAALFLQIRLGCVVVCSGILWLLQQPFGHRHPVSLGVLLTVLLGVMIQVMVLLTGGAASQYYAGLNLILLAVALLMPWSMRSCLLVAGLLVGGYVVSIVAEGLPADHRLLVNNVFFLVSTAVITVVAVALRERLRWREFSHRMALMEALHHKGEFMARMSHELRTPIHVMIGYADILLDDEVLQGRSEARRLVEGVRNHGVILHRLISDLLDFSKAEAGKMELQAAPVEMGAVIEQVADRFRPIVERKGLVLRTRCSNGLPAIVTDRQRLEQILTNLVGNAVKFTEHGEVTIEVEPLHPGDHLLAGFTFLDDRHPAGVLPGVAILVRDTGIGIRDGELTRLAADFQQLDEQAAARYGGTGLGLSISRKLTELLGGRIAVHSRYQHGSTFALVLPAPVSALPAAA